MLVHQRLAAVDDVGHLVRADLLKRPAGVEVRLTAAVHQELYVSPVVHISLHSLEGHQLALPLGRERTQATGLCAGPTIVLIRCDPPVHSSHLLRLARPLQPPASSRARPSGSTINQTMRERAPGSYGLTRFRASSNETSRPRR